MNEPFTVQEGRRRQQLQGWLERPLIQCSLLTLILLNAVLLGLETMPAVMRVAADALALLDSLILGIFVLEIALRIYAHRGAFLRMPGACLISPS